MEKQTKICQKCILTEGLFGLSINPQGLCNFCADSNYINSNWKKVQISEDLKRQKLGEWYNLIQYLQKNYTNKEYSCLIGYSGGKDSTALVDTFVNEYNLRPFLVTTDIGFMTEVAKNNITQTLTKMGKRKDHLFIEATPIFTKLYKYLFTNHDSLEKSLTIEVCHICTDLIHTICVKEAMKRNIKYVIFGFSPDQIARYFYETPPEHTLQNGLPRPENFKKLLNDEDMKWYLDKNTELKDIPYVLYPYHVITYDEREVINRIETKGYILKGKGDPVLTNCHVVKAALMYDFFRYGGLTYALQYAELIRQKKTDLERKKARNYWLKLMENVGRDILNDSFDEDGISSFLSKIEMTREELIKKINIFLLKDPNKDKILKNINMFKNKMFSKEIHKN